MRKFKVLNRLLIPLFSVVGYYCNAQTITRDDTPNISGSVCPSISTSYTLNVSGTAFGNCTRKWTATGGVINGSDNGLSVSVSWNDTQGGTASLKCTLSGCTDSGGKSIAGTDVTFTDQLILSVKDQGWDAYTTNINVDFCTRQNVTIFMPHMYVQGTGGIAQPPLQEAQYSWTLPAGWAVVGNGPLLPISTRSPYILPSVRNRVKFR